MEVAEKRRLFYNRLVYGHYVALRIYYITPKCIVFIPDCLLVPQSLENRTGLGGRVSEKGFLLRRDAVAQGGSPNIEYVNNNNSNDINIHMLYLTYNM